MSDGFERYPHPSASSYPTRLGPLAGVFFLALCGWSAWTNYREGDLFVAGAMVLTGLIIGLGGIGFGFMGKRPRGRFRFINAVVMTRAERAPVDSWVHVAPTRPLPWPLLICNALFTLAMLAALVLGVLQLVGAMPRMNPDTTTGAFLIALLIVLAFAAASGFLAYLNFARRWRNGRFGARPSGVALGERTVSVRVPGRDAEILWEHIVSAEPVLMPGRRNPVPMIRLSVSAAAGIAGHVQLLNADGYTVPTDALYSALRWYLAHPEARRRELGRTEGVERIEGWRLDALARD